MKTLYAIAIMLIFGLLFVYCTKKDQIVGSAPTTNTNELISKITFVAV